MNMLHSPNTISVIRTGCAAQLTIQSPGRTQNWKTKCKRENSLVYSSEQFFPLSSIPQKISSGRKRNAKLLQKFIVCGSSEPKTKDVDLVTSQRGLGNLLNAFYRFSRPHTIFGTIIGITSVSLLPLESFADLSPSLWVGILKALVPSLAMNIYVVGLNQLFDVEIDKINKPNLPLASGEFSMESGVLIVSAFLLMSFTLGILFQSPPLFSALLVSFLLGSAYSVELPTLRWKKNVFLSATCIVIVRAIVVQFAFFIHIQKVVLGRPVMFTRSLLFAVSFMCLFTIVIALFKDIPDVDGDRDFGIQSLSVRLGQQQVFSLCVATLLLAYGAAIVVGASSSILMSKLITVLGHFSFAFLLVQRSQSVNVYDQASVTSFYMFIWKLFYAEYFLIPFVR